MSLNNGEQRLRYLYTSVTKFHTVDLINATVRYCILAPTIAPNARWKQSRLQTYMGLVALPEFTSD
jgi:hypothetical protein